MEKVIRMADKPRQKPNRVTRKDADDVFYATATEPLRKHKAKTPLTQHPMETHRIAQRAAELVEKGKRRVDKHGDQYRDPKGK